MSSDREPTASPMPIEAFDSAWDNVSLNVSALQKILSDHFSRPCIEYRLIGEGVYAKAFLFTFLDGYAVVGRVLLPVRERLKTEAEVAVMDTLRGT